MTDLQEKYQKLATEYSKLRAQLPVLKKAVLDEQAKEEHLKEVLKEREQSIRKYEQEIDSLTFRNQQLSTRVEVLQQDLSNAQYKGKKPKDSDQSEAMLVLPSTKNQPPQPEYSRQNSVIGEELQSKIEENARLHKQVWESDHEHQAIIIEMQNRLSSLEAEASQHQQVLDAARQRSREQIDTLQQEKLSLEVKLQKFEKEMKEALQRAQISDAKLEAVEEDLTKRLEEANRIITTRLPFNDSLDMDLNALNIPSHNRKRQLQTKELVGQCSSLVKELVQGFLNFYTYSQHRAKAYPVDADKEPLSQVNNKLCALLHENASYLRPVEQAFKNLHQKIKEESLTTLETAEGLPDVADKFCSFSLYASKLLPYQLLSLEEECAMSSCSSSLEAKNMELHRSLKNFVGHLSKLENYISILAKQSSTSCNHPRTSHNTLLKATCKAVTDFHESIKEVSKLFNAKVTLEHQLPTATQKLKVTDECIVSSLVSLVTCTGKLSAFFIGSLEFFCESVTFRSRGCSQDSSLGPKSHPAVNIFRQRAADYMNLITRSSSESVPYKTAVHNRKMLFSSTETRDSLAQQVVSFQEKLVKLEQEKEHWMLETQLVQVKFEKEKQKVFTLDKQMKLLHNKMTGSIEDNLEAPPGGTLSLPPGSPLFNSYPSYEVDTSMLGKLETVETGDSDAEMKEELMKQHLAKRIAQLTAQVQMGDSKALHFHAECRALHKRLNLAQNERNISRDLSASANKSIAQLKDELQTTTKSYEGQLSTMSEHLAGMNERLATQKDEIDILKHQLYNAKGGKKGKLNR